MSIPDAVHCITLRTGQYLLHGSHQYIHSHNFLLRTNLSCFCFSAAKNDNVSHIQDLVRGQRNATNSHKKMINQHMRHNPTSVFRQSSGNVYGGNYHSNNVVQLPKISYSYQNASNSGLAQQVLLSFLMS